MSKEEILKEVGESPQYRLFEFFLQEHGITLLEGQMHDIIHEVQIYLDATNDNPVVQQSLTTESMKCYICKKELKGYGYESPLDGERVCENCFSRDQYVNDNTDWDNSVVKENLTSEERAREYFNKLWSYLPESAIYSNREIEFFCKKDYLAGYHSRDEEVKELKEALKFCEIALKNIADPISYLISEADKSGSKVDGRGLIEFANNGCCISNMAKDALVKLEKLKAKQLLKEEEI